jgi:hypothetical protein
MQIQLNPMNNNVNTNQRIPSDSFYNVILTLIIAFAIVWIIYSSIPYSHYTVYLIKNKNENKKKE